MAKKKAPPPPPTVAFAAQLSGLTLQRLQFELEGSWPPSDEDLEAATNFQVSAMRLGPGDLGVEFQVRMHKEGVFSTTVAYRMGFAVEVPDGSDETEFFQRVAARIAPVVAFPYIRETITSLAAKAGAPAPVVLPVLNVGAIFKSEDINIGELSYDEGDE